MDDYLHMGCHEQRKRVNEIQKGITFESVSAHFEQKLNIDILSLKKLETNGVINIIYLIQTDNNKLILRVPNPHPFWKNIKTENEVAILKVVKERTSIPVPTVIDFNICQQKSILNCQYILFEYIENDGTLDQYITSIKDDTDFIDKAKSLIKDGLQYIKQLSEIELNNQFIGGTNLQYQATGARWDGPGIGPFTKVSDMISEGLRVSILHLDKVELSIKQQFKVQKIIASLKKMIQELSSGEIDSMIKNKLFVWKHNDLHPGNISVKNGKINGIYDWQTSRTGLLQQINEQQDLISWFDSIALSEETKTNLSSYQNQILKNYNLPIQPNWHLYKKYFQAMFYSFWSWFYTVTWWSSNTDEQLQGCSRTQQRTNLNQLISVLKRQGYL